MSIDPFLVALVGFLAAIGGAVIQASATRNFDYEKFGRQARNDAYAAYLKSVGQLSFARTPEAQDAAHAAIAEARGRVALYGSARTVSAMAQRFGVVLTCIPTSPDRITLK